MHTLIRTSTGFAFTGESIGATLSEALRFLDELGARADDLIVIAHAGRSPILRARFADLALLAESVE